MEKAMTLDKLLARLNDPYRNQWTSAMIAATCDAAFAVIGEQAHKIDALAAEQGRPVLDDTTGELAAQHYWQHEFYRVEKMVEAEQDRVEELERQLATAKEAVREAAIKECERWPLDPNKMEDSLRWAKVGNGVGNAIAGTCNALSARIRALDLSKLSADKGEQE